MPPELAQLLAYPATILLIGSVAVVSVIGWVIPPLERALILHPYKVRKSGHFHRLLTAGWVHGGLSHLAFNMLALYFFADKVVSVLGPGKFVVLYVSAVVMAFVPTTVRHMHDPSYSSLGASGAVAAVMFCAILLHPRLKLAILFLPIQAPAIVFAALYLAYSAWHSHGSAKDINHDAHFSGAIYGALFAFAFEPSRAERTLRNLF
jgi:membrane associated rhomboid family serine protease